MALAYVSIRQLVMEQWSSDAGFLVATVGATVGPATLWTFPFVVGRNGGGAYLLPYLLAAVSVAVPLVLLELSVGRALHADVVSAFGSIRPEFETLGWFLTGVVLLVAGYSLVLTGWSFAFFVATVAGRDLSFGWFAGTYWPVASFLLVTAAVGGVVALGVERGIERVATVVVPVAILALLGLAAYAATLPGFHSGLSFFLSPDLAALRDPFVWSTAVGHALFSLAAGRGVLLTYGRYLDESVDVVSASLLVTVASVGVGVLSGLVVFPAVFSAGLAPIAGSQLAFSTLPRSFEALPYGDAASAAFFGALCLTGVSSSVVLLEVGVSAVLSAGEWSRQTAALGVTALVFLFGLVPALSYSAANARAFDRPVLDLLDTTVGTYGLPVTAMLLSVAFTWFRGSLSVRAQIPVPSFRLLLKYVVPGVLAAATGAHLWYDTPSPGWHLLPNARRFGSDPRFVGVALALAALTLLGGVLIAYRARRRAVRRYP